jgi:hypothetical protein
MIISLAITGALIALVVFGIRKLATRDSQIGNTGHSVRRFFQYALQFGLVIVVATGLVGLFNRLIGPASLVSADQITLARNTSFVLVGLPVLLGVLSWTRKTIRSDATELNSFGWAAYMFLTTVTSLAVAMAGLGELLGWAVGIERYSSYALAQFLVWSAIWFGHFEVNRRFTPVNRSKFVYLFNSAIGLITAVFGLALIVSGIAKQLIGFSGKDLLLASTDPIKTGIVSLLIGAPVWLLYWVKLSLNSKRDSLWRGYVLIAGVAGGLITSIVSASTLLFKVLVWFLGNPDSEIFSTHFRSAPTSLGAIVAGLLLLWYHKAFASQSKTEPRSEVQRIYEYLMSGIALLASTGGVIMVFVAVFDALAPSDVIASTDATNTLLGAATLILVGVPVWLFYWRRIQKVSQSDTAVEAASGTRRVYLFLLFGVGGVVAVITTLTGAFVLFEAIFAGNPTSELLREIRYPISILLGTIAISGYHWSVYSAERDLVITSKRGPRLLVLIGPADNRLRDLLKDLTGGTVQFWEVDSAVEIGWPHDEVLQLVANSQANKLVLTLTAAGLTQFKIATN